MSPRENGAIWARIAGAAVVGYAALAVVFYALERFNVGGF